MAVTWNRLLNSLGYPSATEGRSRRSYVVMVTWNRCKVRNINVMVGSAQSVFYTDHNLPLKILSLEFTSLAAFEVVILKISGAVSDENSIKMVTPPFQRTVIDPNCISHTTIPHTHTHTHIYIYILCEFMKHIHSYSLGLFHWNLGSRTIVSWHQRCFGTLVPRLTETPVHMC